MARVSAGCGVDMAASDFGVGIWSSADDKLFVVGGDTGETFYYGNFDYSGDAWNGVITRIVDVIYGAGSWSISGLKLPTRYALADNLQSFYRHVFSGDDKLFGSAMDDRLIGYAGDDRMSGKNGSDRLQGGVGNDSLLGGDGADRLSGNDGRDRLEGGGDNDKLFGGLGPDTFAFDGQDGTDRIADFRNRLDKIEITDGARRFGQLEITDHGDDVRVAFADTVIVIEDTPFRQIGAEDFVF